jgi:hypothetical protein
MAHLVAGLEGNPQSVGLRIVHVLVGRTGDQTEALGTQTEIEPVHRLSTIP